MPSCTRTVSLVKGPKALCELQGYVYDAWQRMAEVFDALGNSSRAQRTARQRQLRCSATSTKHSGMRSSGFYAYALDGEKKPVLSVHRIPDIVCGRELSRPTALAGWSNG